MTLKEVLLAIYFTERVEIFTMKTLQLPLVGVKI